MALIKYLTENPEVSTANLSDVLNSFGVMHPNIKPINDSMRMVGTAFTVKAYPGSIITVHKALVEASAGDVIVIEGEGEITSGALLGEIMALECRAKNFAGVVIDGPVRDTKGICELDLPVFARCVTPRVGTNRRVGKLQVPVNCGGVIVNPDDIILGDYNGVVAIPGSQQKETIEAIEKLSKKEEQLIKGIKDGNYLADMLNFKELLYPKV